MWAVRAVLVGLVIVCLVAFAFYNVGTSRKVDVNLIYAEYIDVPLITVVFWAFVAGMVVSLLLFISVYVRLSMEGRATRRQLRNLENEVAVLRNRPIEESADLLRGADKRESDLESPFSES